MRHVYTVIIFLTCLNVTFGDINNLMREWYFDQDDLFLEHTTNVPTVSNEPTQSSVPTIAHESSTGYQPSASPNVISPIVSTKLPSVSTTAPSYLSTTVPSHDPTYKALIMESNSPTGITKFSSVLPSIPPVISPLGQPSLLASFSPTHRPPHGPSPSPTQISMVSTSNTPTRKKSHAPTKVITPSSMPSIFSLPLEELVKVDLSPFLLQIARNDESVNILDEDIADAASTFLTNVFKSELPREIGFKKVLITIGVRENSYRRRLDINEGLTCSGTAFFTSDNPPMASKLDKMVIAAFSSSESTNEFLTILKDRSNNYNQIVDVEARPVSEDREGFSPLLKTILIVVTLVCGALLILFIQIYRARKQQAHDMKYAAQINEYNDVDFYEPQPLTLSNDPEAIKRSLERLKYERAMINQANAKLSNDTNSKTPRNQLIKFGATTELGDKKRYDEEAAIIPSLIPSSSLDTSTSSLWGENATFDDYSSSDAESSRVATMNDKKNGIGCLPRVNRRNSTDSPSITSPIGADIASPHNSEIHLIYSPASSDSDFIDKTRNNEEYNSSIFGKFSSKFRRKSNESGGSEDESEECSEQMDTDSYPSTASDNFSREDALQERGLDKPNDNVDKRKLDNSNYFTSVFTRRY